METKTIQVRVSAEVAEQFEAASEERQNKNKMLHINQIALYQFCFLNCSKRMTGYRGE